MHGFQLNLSSQTSLATRVGVERSNERQDDRQHREERQAMLDWLTTIDYVRRGFRGCAP